MIENDWSFILVTMISATDFKAHCLSLLERVKTQHETITITKHGRVVARLVPASDTAERPWMRLRNTPARWHGDPLAPVVNEREVDALNE